MIELNLFFIRTRVLPAIGLCPIQSNLYIFSFFFFFYRIINRIEKYSNRDVQLLFSFLWRAIFTSFPIRREFHKEKESFEKIKSQQQARYRGI